MKLDYRISLWNYIHYANAPSLEVVIREIRDLGFGAELWDPWRQENGLFRPEQRERLRRLVEGMKVSMHTIMPRAGILSREETLMQIETAAFIGADTIVVHPSTMGVNGPSPDYTLVKEAVAFATERGVTLAMENGDVHAIERTLPHAPALKTCIDIGHVYNDGFTLPECLRIMRDRLVHLHLQDRLPEGDHHTPGTGTIPRQDWEMLVTTLKEIAFQGGAVFEIAPRRPKITAREARTFLDSLL
jgi:sugar phosphate isomerase/epimerase